MDVLAVIVIFVLLCLLVCVKKPFTLRIELPKEAESTTPVKKTVAPVKSGNISNPSDVDKFMIGSGEAEADIVEAKRGFGEAIRRRNWTEKDVDGTMKRRGAAKTDFCEKRRNGAETDVAEAATRSSGAKTDFGVAVNRRIGDEKYGFLADVNEQVTVPQATDKYAEFRNFVRQYELAKKMKDLGTTYGLIKYIKQLLKELKEINIAITGISGAGKSSLINALRKLKPNEHGAAKVGVVETTTERKKYTYTETKCVVLWDLPGVGTKTFAKDTYLEDMKFSQYDIVILVTSARFLENDIWLAKQLYALGKYVLFVRTKIDFDIINAERDYPDGFKKEEIASNIRDDMIDNMRRGELKQAKIEIYLVSSAETDSYDFKKLNEKLKGLLNMRAKAIPAMLKKHVQSAIKEKRKLNKNEFKWHKFGSFIYGFLPVPNLRTGLGNLNVSSIHERCLEKFCLDTKSLNEIAKQLGERKESLQKNLKSYGMIKRSTGETLLEITEMEEYPTTVGKYSKYMVPDIGFFYSAHKNVCTFEKCLEKICDVAAEDELGLVTKILHKLERDLNVDI